MIQEVTVQYSLCNEPWLKYNIAAVADQGFKRSQWTAARLRRDSLYLETHGHRFELSYDGDVNGNDAAAVAAAAAMATAAAPTGAGAGAGVEAGAGAGAASGGVDGSEGAGAVVGEDTYRWARCKTPLPLAGMRALGIPLPAKYLEEIKTGLKWDDIKWGAASVVVAGAEVNVVRLHFLSKTFD
jgi:hypothetical protein